MTDELWLDGVFRELQVNLIQARFFHCEKGWRMLERVIADDMFFYVIKGRGHVTVGNHSYPLRPGICAHFRRKVRHSGSHDPKNPITVITLHYNATVMQSLTLPELFDFPDLFRANGDAFLEESFHEATRESEGKNIGRERALEAIVMRLLLHLVRSPRYRPSMKIEYREAQYNDLLRLQPALRRMSLNLSEPDSIGELAKACGLSLAQFGKIFSRSLRMAPIQYLRRVRMARACWLLRNTPHTIEAIATEVGYRETSFFARTFKELMGSSPGIYRHRIVP